MVFLRQFVVWAVFVIFLSGFIVKRDFRQDQKKFPRVREAYNEKEGELKELCKKANGELSGQDIFIRAFKEEEELEVWVRRKDQKKFTVLKTYSICRKSGNPGPKRQQGDRQVPEGYYYIDRFNPSSSFHLSLGINYPNQADRNRERGDLGGDVFLHGSCVTIGCIPLTDDKIKELYVLAVEAKTAGQSRIPVHIFPCRFNGKYFQKLKDNHGKKNPSLLTFWENLKTGYDFFENNRNLPVISVNAIGEYVYNE